MRSSIILLGLAAVLPTVIAEELNASDVPSACTTICQPIVELTNTCDIDPEEANNKRRMLRAREDDDNDDDDDSAEEAVEANCICTNKSFDVASVMALCASCISENGNTTDDVDKIMSQCSFTSTSYTAAATSVVAGIAVEATKPTTTSSTTTATATSTATEGISSANSATVKTAGTATMVAGMLFAVLLSC